jgi:hypothetical protein
MENHLAVMERLPERCVVGDDDQRVEDVKAKRAINRLPEVRDYKLYVRLVMMVVLCMSLCGQPRDSSAGNGRTDEDVIANRPTGYHSRKLVVCMGMMMVELRTCHWRHS